MGKGAFITVHNKSNSLIKIETGGTQCMYGTGDWSNLIPSGNTSKRQYIEAKSSGIPCCCEHSSVDYGISILNTQTGEFQNVGGFNLYESGNNWSSTYVSSNSTVSVTPGEQFTVTVTFNG
ncbi:hypothetical protein C7447_10137 [Tenacibaculum adriaticum]|uniref:Uncharacterized protein n=1 Tax=Tenacibaculum adriaticum TaxID=413713 RepID=A0A5S5DU56_9FLAO|nr:hypothetical protein [Tenacibaculum adriaticum]TYP99441.1 hypothetical protein C7447_10137 [Tenacibaculum adriaticum]